MALEGYKADFLRAALSGQALRFGSFELKSKRISPYFFNAGDFYAAHLLQALASAYAHTIARSFVDSSTQAPAFDVIFGPAYKGIPLATAATLELARLDPARFGRVEYSFDRKEAKDHGEGGTIVGAPLRGRRVLIIDDVVSAGTAKREAVAKIEAQGGKVAGIVIALDRQETLPNGTARSAIGELRAEYGFPIVAILTLEDIIAGARAGFATDDDIKRIEEYKAKYGATD